MINKFVLSLKHNSELEDLILLSLLRTRSSVIPDPIPTMPSMADPVIYIATESNRLINERPGGNTGKATAEASANALAEASESARIDLSFSGPTERPVSGQKANDLAALQHVLVSGTADAGGDPIQGLPNSLGTDLIRKVSQALSPEPLDNGREVYVFSTGVVKNVLTSMDIMKTYEYRTQ
jgi:hypothetical protein